MSNNDLVYKMNVMVRVGPGKIRDHLRSTRSAVDAMANVKAALAPLHYRNEIDRTWELVKDDPILRAQFEDFTVRLEQYADWFREALTGATDAA